MTDFCHITPIPHLDLVKGRPFHLVLAHLVEESETYVRFYKEQKERYNCTIILDNSAFEMYKQKKPMYDATKLIEMAKKIGADYVVMSDYPNEVGSKTITAAKQMAPILKDNGFGTFFCPQSQIGDKDDLISGFGWAADSDLVDYVGVSILSVPNAYGVEKNNKLQRFVSRFMFLQELHAIGIIDQIKNRDKKVHMLGMTDGPAEIKLMAPFRNFIDSWDSSAAIWYGLKAKKHFDNSPTGLLNGKFEEEVDFYYENHSNKLTATINMSIIDNYVHTYLNYKEIVDHEPEYFSAEEV